MKLEFETSTSAIPFAGSNVSGDIDFRNDAAKVSQMLQTGIKAAQVGNRSEARQLLTQVTEAEPRNETAWLWMASISEYPEELLIFLNNVLTVNPNNSRALEWTKATKSLLAKTFVQRGIEASNEANKDFAKQCFWQAIAHDDRNETAWLSLASVSDSADGKIANLQKVLMINPENESAKTLLKEAKNQCAESLLRKANSAAVAGDRDAAKEMLQEVLKHSPELEEAWILKSYLADSFSEKITCFEKVLTFNPENEMATSGLESLRAMMARAESKKAEQAAQVAKALEKISMENSFGSNEEQVFLAEAETDENSPTQELEFPPDFVRAKEDLIQADNAQNINETFRDEAKEDNENFGDLTMNSTDKNLEYSTFDNAKQNYNDVYSEQVVSQQPVFEGNSAEETFPAEKSSFNYFSSNATVPAAEISGVQNLPKSSVEMTTCPFCSAENEANAFVCGSCRTILTLSDVEMLLARNDADQEILRQAVGRMESEKNMRVLSADELKNLAIGHINLRNLRQGIIYLQKAAQMNPNDVMLYSQVNSLKIRLSEIEQQESLQSTMSKGRKILIVDDSATVRKLISSKLEKSGHNVVCAADGLDALEKIKGFVPDLILLDIMMPQLDGYQVCKLIRTNESTKDVPIVMISGKDGFFDKVRGRMAGTTGYITKPFGPETLMKTIETYIIHRGDMLPGDEEM